MSNTSNLIHCHNGHVFSKKRYGTVCPYCNMETDTKEKRETQRSDVEIEEELFREDIKPVCGWIVCIDGPRQGKDYQIVQGKNFVGRADDMDIQILGDNEISRRNHAVIVFDPKKKETVLLPGHANGIVNLNGNAEYAPATLNTYDAANNPDPPVRRRSGPAAHPAVHRRQRQAVTQPRCGKLHDHRRTRGAGGLRWHAGYTDGPSRRPGGWDGESLWRTDRQPDGG